MLWAAGAELLIRLLVLLPLGAYGGNSSIVLLIALRAAPENFRLAFPDVSRRRALVYAGIGVAAILGIIAKSVVDLVVIFTRADA